MRRLITILLITFAALALSVPGAMAHVQSPPGEGEGVGFIPANHHGHAGIQCAHEAGAPPFPAPVPVDCPANR